MVIGGGSGVLESAFVGVVRHTGFEDAIDLVEQFAHDGDDDLLGRFAVEFESFRELLKQRVEDARGHGGHEESAPQPD